VRALFPSPGCCSSFTQALAVHLCCSNLRYELLLLPVATLHLISLSLLIFHLSLVLNHRAQGLPHILPFGSAVAGEFGGEPHFSFPPPQSAIPAPLSQGPCLGFHAWRWAPKHSSTRSCGCLCVPGTMTLCSWQLSSLQHHQPHSGQNPLPFPPSKCLALHLLTWTRSLGTPSFPFEPLFLQNFCNCCIAEVFLFTLFALPKANFSNISDSD